MARLARLLCSLLACVGISGCQRSEPSATNSSHPRPESGQIKQLIESFANAPLGESIIEVSRGLAQCNILLPTQDVHEQGKPLRLKTSADNEGNEWVYAYTDESELLAAFPDGSPYVQLKFADAFMIVERDSRFGGMFINHTAKYQYLIPREVFGTVKNELKADSQSLPN